MENEPPAVLAAIVAVNKAIAEQGIAKADKNAQQGFSFRGVDRVYDAMAGLMADQGLFSTSRIISEARAERVSKGGGALFVVYLKIEYTFHCAVDGSTVSTEVIAEAMDSGDKASSKVMSVAHRTALLQLSTAPVNPTEPDAETYQVEAFASKQDHDAVRELLVQVPEDRHAEVKGWRAENGLAGWPLYKAQLEALTAYVTELLEKPFSPPPPQVEKLPLGDGAPV